MSSVNSLSKSNLEGIDKKWKVPKSDDLKVLNSDKSKVPKSNNSKEVLKEVKSKKLTSSLKKAVEKNPTTPPKPVRRLSTKNRNLSKSKPNLMKSTSNSDLKRTLELKPKESVPMPVSELEPVKWKSGLGLKQTIDFEVGSEPLKLERKKSKWKNLLKSS